MVFIATIILSCQKETSCEGCISSNNPPVTCAGQDNSIILPDNTVLLDGSCSTDPENDLLSYIWTMISGPDSVQITNGNKVKAQVSNLVEGTYTFQLKVTDGGGLFSMDTVLIFVNPEVSNRPVDVYVAGNKNDLATYWKNGQEVTLSSVSPNSNATSIAVEGTDVYVAGWEGDFFMYKHNRAKYWKNGQAVTLSTGADAEATSIVVVDGNVYVAGHENSVAKYWKNGQPVPLTNGQHQAFAHAIAVVGNDVYVAGSEQNGTAHVAKYWKNGQAVSLTNGTAVHAMATSIAVAGANTYVAGWEGDFFSVEGGKGAIAKYWKNGQAVSLTNGTSYAYPQAIALFGNEVYVGGFEIDPRTSLRVAKYWKNGPLSPNVMASGAEAMSIVVVSR